jgi:hypothetical protein
VFADEQIGTGHFESPFQARLKLAATPAQAQLTISGYVRTSETNSQPEKKGVQGGTNEFRNQVLKSRMSSDLDVGRFRQDRPVYEADAGRSSNASPDTRHATPTSRFGQLVDTCRTRGRDRNGLDIAPNPIETARSDVPLPGLEIKFDEG